jgi:hypothetical protein
VRKFAIGPLLATASLLATTASTRGVDALGPRVAAGAGITVRVPHGWHLIRTRLTDVLEPVQRLAVASFPVRLALHPCDCGLPNISNLPRAGAFLLIFERTQLGTADLKQFPRRPTQFQVAQDNPHWNECAGPSWGTVFRTSGRAFQVNVYLGPAAGREVRQRADLTLDSLSAALPGSV